jgi:hypothetical protein
MEIIELIGLASQNKNHKIIISKTSTAFVMHLFFVQCNIHMLKPQCAQRL